MSDDETIIRRVHGGPAKRRRGRPYFTVLSGKGVGRVFRPTVGESTIGRGSSADFELNEDGVSRLHAKLVREVDGTAKIMDLNSTNGTYVNGRRVEVESLREGDRVRIGQSATLDFRYEYSLEQPSVEAPEAKRVPEEASAIRKQRGYDNIAGALDSLGNVYSKGKQYDQAISAYRRTLALREKKFGPGHPMVASILDTIGVALHGKGDFAEAIACHERALKIYGGLSATKPHSEMAHVWVHLGEARLSALDIVPALEALERANDALEARGSTDIDLAPVRFALARAYAQTGRPRHEVTRLAEQAREGFLQASDRAVQQRASDVDAWLNEAGGEPA